jgi:hypothetical protein
MDSGLIAVDKVGNKIRFYDPRSLAEIKVVESPESTVHELALSCDRQWAFVPLYGDGIYGNNKHPNNKILIIDLRCSAWHGGDARRQIVGGVRSAEQIAMRRSGQKEHRGGV